MKGLFVCYPRCSTCKKAKNWLDQNEVAYTERDIAKDNPTEEELRGWVMDSGLELKRFFNTSGLKYRELNLKERLSQMSDDEKFALLATDGLLVKRPVFIGENAVLVGFKPTEWEKILN